METTATSKGQIVIPAELRRRFGIKQGTRISVQVDEDTHTIVLKPITREFIVNLRGIDRGGRILNDLMEDRAREKVREESSLGQKPRKSRKKRR